MDKDKGKLVSSKSLTDYERLAANNASSLRQLVTAVPDIKCSGCCAAEPFHSFSTAVNENPDLLTAYQDLEFIGKYVTGKSPFSSSLTTPSNWQQTSRYLRESSLPKINRNETKTVQQRTRAGRSTLGHSFQGDPLPNNTLYSPLLKDIDWKGYKYFLYKLWEENSLSNASLDSENSSLPSLTTILSETAVPNASDIMNFESSLPETSITSVSNEKNVFQGIDKRTEHALLLRSKDSQSDTNTEISHKCCKLDTEGTPSVRVSASVPSKREEQSEVFAQIHGKINEKSLNRTRELDGKLMATHKMCDNSKIRKKCVCFDACSCILRTGEHLCCKATPQCVNCPRKTEIYKLKLDLQQAEDKILAFSLKMEDQSSYIQELLEDRQRYLSRAQYHPSTKLQDNMSYPVFDQGGYKLPHQMPSPGRSGDGYKLHSSLGRTMSYQHSYIERENEIPSYDFGGSPPHTNHVCQHSDGSHHKELNPSDLMSRLANRNPEILASLRDQLVALQMHNLELSLFLKKEEQKRKDAEDNIRRDRNYIRTLEENIQTLNASRVVMDPLTYKQVADNYMASRKKPVRRSRTCNPYSLGSTDLVCDSESHHLQVKKQSSSCPSSPLGVKATSAPKDMRTSSHKWDSPCDSSCSQSPDSKISKPTSPVQFTRSPPSSLASMVATPHCYCSSPLSTSSNTSIYSNTNSPENWGIRATKTSSLNHDEYQDLLKSIEKLDMSPS